MTAPPTVADALAWGQAHGVDRLDAQRLLADRLQRPRSWVLAHPECPLPAGNTLFLDLQRCAAGEPLAYVLGTQEFHGLPLQVDRRVLVPRADTETLVDWALELLSTDLSHLAAPRVLDLGTGSGAIALALQKAQPRAKLCAVDASADALDVARANAQLLGLDVEFHHSNWWTALPRDSSPAHFDLVVSNPPYIAEADAHLAALTHEPQSALVSGPDGLSDIRAIVGGARPWLAPGAWLIFEHGYDQADAVATLLAQAGFSAIAHRYDLPGVARCTGGRAFSPLV